MNDDKRRREATSTKVTAIMAELDRLVDGVDLELEHEDLAAVRVLSSDARRSLEQLNAKLLRIPARQR